MSVRALDRCGVPYRLPLRRALSAVLRGRASIVVAALRHKVPMRALRRLVREGRMPW